MTGPNQRAIQAREWLCEHGFEALIAFSDGQNSFLESNAVYVFTNCRPIGESAVVLTRDGKLISIITPAWDADRSRLVSSVDEVIATNDLAATLCRWLDSNHLTASKIACAGLWGQRQGLASQVLECFRHPPHDAGPLASQLAQIRSPDELVSIRRAVQIAELGYQRLKEFVRSGMREYELAAEIYCYMKELGAEDNFLLMSASQHNLAVRAAGGRVFESGDVVLAEITPCFNGQFVQICRTLVLGPPSQPIQEKFSLLQRAMARGLAAAVPGAKVSEATEAMNECFREAGYGEYCRPPYMRVRGHGLGITSDRPGDLHSSNETRFEEGMVFVMHPNQYLPETGYLMCGETVFISHNGGISLSENDAALESIEI